MGKGLVSFEQYRENSAQHYTILEYKKIVRASVLWMSFSEHIQFNNMKFSQLNALMSTDKNQPKGIKKLKIV